MRRINSTNGPCESRSAKLVFKAVDIGHYGATGDSLGGRYTAVAPVSCDCPGCQYCFLTITVSVSVTSSWAAERQGDIYTPYRYIFPIFYYRIRVDYVLRLLHQPPNAVKGSDSARLLDWSKRRFTIRNPPHTRSRFLTFCCTHARTHNSTGNPQPGVDIGVHRAAAARRDRQVHPSLQRRCSVEGRPSCRAMIFLTHAREEIVGTEH